MNRIRKVMLLIVILTLVSHSLIVPVDAAVGSDNGQANEEKQMIVYADEDLNIKEIPLFSEESTESERITFLENYSEVTLLVKGEGFSYIMYEENDGETVTEWEGYIENNFLRDLEDLVLDKQFEEENNQEDRLIEANGKTDLEEESTRGKNSANSVDSSTESEEHEDALDAPSEDNQPLQIGVLSANVENSLSGIALKNKTHVYKSTNRHEALKSYNQGTVLRYRASNHTGWYEATVYVNGKAHIGYINQEDVENTFSNKKLLKGLALKNPTHVYSRAATNSKALKSYQAGSLLIYASFSPNWYEANVIVNGKRHTGYIHISDVETIEGKQQELQGIALKSPTAIYDKASTHSRKIKTYAAGSILKYKTFSTNWYEATVFINGKARTGYIYINDVENAHQQQNDLKGIAIKNPTVVYSKATRHSKQLKSYGEGKILSFKSFTSNWYIASVIVNGKRHTGYIHVDDVTLTDVHSRVTDYNISLNNAVALQMNRLQQTDKYRNQPAYVSASYIEYIGKGFVTANNVDVKIKPEANNSTAFKLNNGAAIDIIGTETGTNISGSTLWYKIKIDNKEYYVHSSVVRSNQAKVIADELNVRAEQNTTSHIYGALKKNSIVTIVNHGKNWHQISYGAWRNPTAADVKNFMTPNNGNKLQHLRLDLFNGASAAELNRLLAGQGILNGRGQAFVNGAKKHSINEVYLIAHAFLETGYGKSQLATGVEVGKNKSGKLVLVTNNNRKDLTAIKTTYNMFGIGAVDSSPLQGGAVRAYEEGWFTPELAIEGGAKFVSENYIYNEHNQNTLYKMRWNPRMSEGYAWKQYASDIAWANKQAIIIENMYKQMGVNPILVMDTPRY